MAFRIDIHREVTQVITRQDSAIGIMRWGESNAFPQTLKNLIEQSPTAKPCVERTAKFYKGGAFEGEDQIVSSYGLTLKQLVSILAEDYAAFKAFAIHCNYNIEGDVVGMSPIRITDQRFNEFDELNFSSKIGYHENFGTNSEVKKVINQSVTSGSIKWFDRFNPNAALEQIRRLGKGESEMEVLINGVSNYQGQVLYHSDSGLSSYPIPPLQSAINYVLADIENSILMRKESSTGFIDTYFLKTTLPSDDSDLIALENAIDGAQGARGTGKIITMSGMSPEDLNATVLEKIDVGSNSSGTIDSITKSVDLCQRIIQGAYLIPPVLAGNSADTGFSEPDLRDAYFVFNSVTQDGRDLIESTINRVLKHTKFPIKEIKLQKLSLDEAVSEQKEGEKKADPSQEVQSGMTKSQENIRVAVGGVTALIEMQRALKEGITSESAAVSLIENIYGFSNETAKQLLGIQGEPQKEEVVDPSVTESSQKKSGFMQRLLKL